MKKAQLIEGSVPRLLIQMAIPMVFGLLSMVVFNLVDAFFVGKLGTKQLAALSFTFPVIAAIGGLSVGLGMGISAVVSRAIGSGNNIEVKRLTTDGLLLSLVLVVICAVGGILTLHPLFTLLGATEDVIPIIKDYMMIWYPGVIFVIPSMVAASAIRATGDMKTPSLVMFIAVIINIILDPLLIFGLGPFPMLGVRGAAISTVIARSSTLFVSLWVLRYREQMIYFGKMTYHSLIQSWREISYIGLPSAGAKMIAPVATGAITHFIASYGKEAVAGFGVATRVEFFALVITMSLTSAIGPFVGQNSAAGKHDRVKDSIRYSESFSMIWGFGAFILLAIFARPIASIFNNNADIVSTVALYFRIIPIGYGCYSILVLATTTLNVLKKPFHATGLILIEMFGLCIPLAYVGSHFFALPGIFTGITLAYIISGILGHILLQIIPGTRT